MTDWLDGFEVIQASHEGGTINDGGHAKGVIHTTEGSSIEGAVGAYRMNTGWPLATVDPVTARRVQHYPLWTSQRGLEHPSGTVATNGVVRAQVEVVAFAADSQDWPTGWKHWFGAEVLAPISAALEIPLVCTVIFGGSEAYGTAGPYRLSEADWLAYDGWLGHQHVPRNVHWDPGRLDIQACLAAAGAHLPPVEDEMPTSPAYAYDTTGVLWVAALGADQPPHVYMRRIGIEKDWVPVPGGGEFTSAPTLASGPNGSMTVGARGANGAAWRNTYDGKQDKWSGWLSDGGQVA